MSQFLLSLILYPDNKLEILLAFMVSQGKCTLHRTHIKIQLLYYHHLYIPTYFHYLQSDNLHLLPGWLAALLTEKFFNICAAHKDARKNEKNIFCLDCCQAICIHCLTPHCSHRLLQIRRYIYHDVLRLKDAEKLLDCVSVQCYITNSEKVVFLNQRPKTRPWRGSSKLCIICDRAVQDAFLFCSIFCKLQHMMKTGVNLSDHICNRESLVLPELGDGDEQMMPETALEPTASGESDGASAEGVECRALASITTTTITEIVKKKRSVRSCVRPDCGPATDVPAAVKNRRKNPPHRSPLQ
ncbi:PREDICTED: uncharacterized protein LOC109156748 [Ipomoea nil]|uniref:uncharacterized protein LOC109156748 n=1 Tax=Ipomoea nil TaxID=35883 RepID=UPI000901593B|nr:PREDICTED: uncharacterized protein LOC109156748 [Ipomoea nil]